MQVAQGITYNVLQQVIMVTQEIIEGAYLAGFEPSRNDLTADELLAEAKEYLMKNLMDN